MNKWVGAALLGAMAVPALSAPVAPMACTSFTSVSTMYDQCVGLNSGNTSVGGANAAFAGDSVYAVEYKDDNPGTGSTTAAFDLVAGALDTVAITFNRDFGGGGESVVVALKFGGQGSNQLGYFLFSSAFFGSGSTLSFSWSPSFAGDGISHASVFGRSSPPQRAPEPGSMALALAALGAAAALRRRRSC